MAASDDFSKFTGGLESSASGAESVTPHDTNELTKVSRAIYVGGDGNLAVVMKNGDTVTISGAIAGMILPIRVKQIKSTGTTATNILSFY